MKRNKHVFVLEDTHVGKLEVFLVLLYKDVICYEHFIFSFIEIMYDAVRCIVYECNFLSFLLSFFLS
jgi:hypothetical protein